MPSIAKLERTLKEQASRSVYIEKDGRGEPRVATPFYFADGDGPVLAVIPCEDGWMITDRGNTLMRLSWMLDESEYDRPDTQRRIDVAVARGRISRRGDILERALSERDCVEDIFEFVHALMRIDDIGSDDRRRTFACPTCAPSPAES